MPDFRIKQDVLPGRFTTVWFQAKTPGSYQILCTEYCGQGHSMMRGEVVALASGDYERWLSGSDLTADLAGPIYVPPAVPGGDTPPEQVSLVRLGARNAYLIYRRTEEDMPARSEEIKHAKEEGV